VLIAVQEVDTPHKPDPEPGLRLIGRCGAMSEEHRKIDLPRQLVEKRSMVLNRMRDDDCEAQADSSRELSLIVFLRCKEILPSEWQPNSNSRHLELS
jgi:hypothetical protein